MQPEAASPGRLGHGGGGDGDFAQFTDDDQAAAQVNVPAVAPNPAPPSTGEPKRLHIALMRDAAIKGDWHAAEILLHKDRSLAIEKLTERGDRPLHIAAAFKRTKFVQELVQRLDADELLLLNLFEHSALHFAIPSQDVDIVSSMIEKNDNLMTLYMNSISPLQIAVWFGNKKMVSYLHKTTRLKGLPELEWFKILIAGVMTKQYDLVISIVAEDIPDVRTKEKDLYIASCLFNLATHDLSKISSTQEAVLQFFIHFIRALPSPGLRGIFEQYLMRKKGSLVVEKLCTELGKSEQYNISELGEVVHQAAKVGNIELLTRMTRMDLDLVLIRNQKGQTFFQVGALHRQERVLSLIYQTGCLLDFFMLAKDNDGNYMLHLLGLGPDGSPINNNASNNTTELPDRVKIVSGAALQMQRELLWFKELEKMSHPQFREALNENKKSPKELFRQSHKSLMEEGEKWMKDTANSSMLMATLIATVAFTAAFTVPGGNDDQNGIPRFLNQSWFDLFVISDAIAMFFSTGAIIMFLSILTSRYMEQDFESSLPKKLLLGLTALFGSIVGTLLAFTSTFFLLFNERKWTWLPIFIAGLACVSLASLFVRLHIKLWMDIFCSTYLSKKLFLPGNHKLFN